MRKTRFEREISGELGQYWKDSAEREVQKLIEDATSNAIVEEDGAIYWKSSNNYLPDDCCEKLEYGNFAFSRERTREKRELQNKKFLEDCRKKEATYSDEMIYEMRAAFGSGTKVVDMVSGQTILL